MGVKRYLTVALVCVSWMLALNIFRLLVGHSSILFGELSLQGLGLIFNRILFGGVELRFCFVLFCSHNLNTNPSPDKRPADLSAAARAAFRAVGRVPSVDGQRRYAKGLQFDAVPLVRDSAAWFLASGPGNRPSVKTFFISPSLSLEQAFEGSSAPQSEGLSRCFQTLALSEHKYLKKSAIFSSMKTSEMYS